MEIRFEYSFELWPFLVLAVERGDAYFLKLYFVHDVAKIAVVNISTVPPRRSCQIALLALFGIDFGQPLQQS